MLYPYEHSIEGLKKSIIFSIFMKKSQIVAPFMILAVVMALAGCSPTADTTTNANDSVVNGQTQTKPSGINMQPQTAPELTDEQKQQLKAGEADHKPATLTFTVDGGNFYFTPGTIKVKKGDTVIINFKNDGGMHNWVLDEFQVTMAPIKTGQTAAVQFVADKAGTFEYYCSVGSHRAMGMKGQLIVE